MDYGYSSFDPYGEYKATPLARTDTSDDRVVCYGTVCDVKAHILESASPKVLDSICSEGPSSETSPYIGVLPSGSNIILKVEHDGTLHDVAVVNTRSANALIRIAYIAFIRFEGLLTQATRDSIIQKSRPRISDVFTIEINIFGPATNGAAVGRKLSELGVFLQHPSVRRPDYHNPHWLSFDSSFDLDGGFTPTPPEEPDMPPEQQKVMSVEQVLDSLPKMETLGEKEVDGRVVTKLMSHQKEGVDFIFKRELSELPPSSRLWTAESTDGDKSSHSHKITLTESSTMPEEARSGLIADEMGLGKSLTVLAAIVSSLERAHKYPDQANPSSGPTRSLKHISHTTLVVVPSALVLDEWIAEIRRHLAPDTVKIHRYHGQYKEIDHKRLDSFDIVFTTYSTVETDYFRGRRFFLSVRWFRIVLDEAHTIRNTATKQFKAVSFLEAEHRWCLTGTPIQNKMEDLQALVQFLRIPVLEDSSIFRCFITKPARSSTADGLSNLRLLLSSICLRRNKSLLNLQDPEEHRPLIRFTDTENRADMSMIEDFRRQIDLAVTAGSSRSAQVLILRLMLRRRIFCNTGVCETFDATVEDDVLDDQERFSLLQQIDEACCARCSKTILSVEAGGETSTGSVLSCKHLLCTSCCLQWKSSTGEHQKTKRNCPICGELANLINSKSPSEVEKRAFITLSEPSAITSKFAAVVNDILQHCNTAKSLVFSCWKSSLDSLALHLTGCGVAFTRIHGDMSIAERRKALVNFQQKKHIAALLMTMGTGAEGLNVAEASRIHILEPQWNPATESQAIGRVARMGQVRGVVIVRYVVQGSIEQLVESRQTEKIRLAKEGFQSNGVAGPIPAIEENMARKPMCATLVAFANAA